MVVVAVTATLGSVLLLVSPSEALDVVVPVLIVLALVMVIFQKRITGMVQADGERRAARRARRRRQTLEEAAACERRAYRSPGLPGAMGAAATYGGYFTAAQGILYLGVLGATTGRSMGAVNSVKNLASLVVNLAAAIVYVIAYFALGAEIIWV